MRKRRKLGQMRRRRASVLVLIFLFYLINLCHVLFFRLDFFPKLKSCRQVKPLKEVLIFFLVLFPALLGDERLGSSGYGP